jgi:type IV secretory pathway VirJ component
VLPEIARLDPSLLQCFYGVDEEDSACPDSAFARAEVIRTKGGHHFGGDYAALADTILAGARRRAAARRILPPAEHCFGTNRVLVAAP